MSTIEKLNSSIAGLQKAIQSLIQSNKTTKISAQPAMIAPNKSQAISPIALSPISEGQLGMFAQKAVDDQVKKAVLKAALHNPEALIQQQMYGTGQYKGIFGGLKGSEAQKQAFIRLFDGVAASDIVKDGKLTPYAKEFFKDYLPKPPPPKFLSWQTPDFLPSESRKPSKQMMEGMRLMAGSYILGGLSNLGSGQTWE